MPDTTARARFRSLSRWLASGVLGLAAACAPAETGSESPTRELWLTVGTDALDTVRDTLGAERAERAIQSTDNPDVAIAWVQARDLESLSSAMHEKHLRCGGFRAHTSLDAARVAAVSRPEASPVAGARLALDNPATAGALMEQVDDAEILDTIGALSSFPTRLYTSSTGVEAAEMLAEKWTGYAGDRADVSVELRQHDDWPQPSVILTIEGAESPEEIVVIGGHLDSISFFGSAPGADDDASGIASLTEVIRVAMATGYRPARTVKFIGYAAEEVGLRGSGEIADDFAARGVDVIGAMQLDMTNFTESTQVDLVLISDFTNQAQTEFLGQLIDAYLPELSWTLDACGYACSDHASWTGAGFPAVFPFEAPLGQHNDEIHSSGDTLAVSGNSAVHAARFSRIAAAYVAELAGGAVGDEPPPPGDLDHLLISQVGYDVPGTDSLGEFIELYNPTGEAIDLAGLALHDNFGIWRLPAATLPAGAHLAIARNAAGFAGLYGVEADLAGLSLALGNGRDLVQLRAGAELIDEVEWESADWPIAASTGKAVVRAALDVDTDTVEDWIVAPAAPRTME